MPGIEPGSSDPQSSPLLLPHRGGSNDCREKSGRLNLAKGNYSCCDKSIMMKLKFDLYYVNANSYTKFQVNISKDCRERSGKLECDWQTVIRTDNERTKSPRQADRGQYFFFWNGRRYAKSDNTIQKDLKERISNYILLVQFERYISISQSNLLYP